MKNDPCFSTIREIATEGEYRRVHRLLDEDWMAR